MRNRIVWKFLGVYVSLILAAILILNFFVSLRLRDYYKNEISKRLRSNSDLISYIVRDNIVNDNTDGIGDKISELSENLGIRITVIDKRGNVLADSERAPGLMDDHSDRLEVVRALEKGFGESTRFSDTLGYNMKYLAVAVKEKDHFLGIVRLALSLEDVEEEIRGIYRIVLIGGVFAALFVLIAGFFISQNIVNPITQMKDIAQALSKGDFAKRVNTKRKDELGVLAKSLNSMAD
ncbi:MAG: HAMP domain-containing protein, partial [Candidatus Omnitrophota bacterium]